jgi:uncharacterized protein
MMRKIPAPRVLPEAKPYWDAADQGRLLLKRCDACGEVHHYPRDVCPFCMSTETRWVESDGTGVLYSFSTMGQGDAAYTLAMVTLDEGVTMMSNLVGCDPATARIGDRVRVRFQPTDGGPAVPVFAPAEGVQA